MKFFSTDNFFLLNNLKENYESDVADDRAFLFSTDD